MSYVRRKTPGWRPQFNGLRGLGQVRKLVVSGLGCACKKGLGQDETDLNFGIPTGLISPEAGGNIANVSPTVAYPASPDSGLTYVPNELTPITAAASPSSGIVSVASAGIPQSVLVGAGVGVGAPSLGTSNSWLWIGGAAFLALLLIETTGKRR